MTTTDRTSVSGPRSDGPLIHNIPDVTGLSKGDAAVAYVQAGWRVGPLWWIEGGSCACGKEDCRSAGKHPITRPDFVPKGFLDFSGHSGQVAGWWRRYPDANIGLLLPEEVFALDIDDPERWASDGIALPGGGPWQETGSGGGRQQHLYRLDGQDRQDFRFNAPIRGTGAETKGDGHGYVVVAPSVTRSGYVWRRTGALQPAPEALLDLLRPPAPRRRRGRIDPDDCCAIPSRIDRAPGGYPWLLTRNAHLRSAHRLTGEPARTLLEACLSSMDPPYAPGEGEAVIDRILEYDERNPERIASAGRGDVAAGAFVPTEPEDRATATASPLAEREYVEDVIAPGRILVVSGEEGTGKSFAVDHELGIRVAVAGGSFAGTWPVRQTGTVLVLSEMHPDDDFGREEVVLASLGIDRSALAGRYFRQGLLETAGGRPALLDPGWRAWVTEWMREHEVVLLIVDTATAATGMNPWGPEIHQVYNELRQMMKAIPELSIVLVLHMKKPQGRGDRRISDVIGEWGRWCDRLLMMENDGRSLERVKLTLRKRVRRERGIIATKYGGLLIDPVDAARSGPKVPTETLVDAVTAAPGSTYAELAKTLGVSKDTVTRYVKSAAELEIVPGANRKPDRVYLRGAAAP